jgi:hypothetical protein
MNILNYKVYATVLGYLDGHPRTLIVYGDNSDFDISDVSSVTLGPVPCLTTSFFLKAGSKGPPLAFVI